MTILSCAQDAAVILSRTASAPTSLFSASDPFAAELLVAAKQVAESLVKEEHDWRALTLLQTCQGDATTTVFPLPAGFERLIKDAKVHSLRFKNATFRWARDLDQWLFIKDNLLVGSPGNVVLLNNSMQIFPPMPVSDTGRFYYISNYYALKADGTPQPSFKADTDTFALDERLMRLGMVWRWRANKRLEYAEDLKDFEVAKSAAMAAEKGNQSIVIGRQRVRHGAGIAYPAMLGA